ncbi:MAG: IscS subfamily cysteine desulfurase [Cytophagales bacterium CG12_big_fil_rev_8_21_14_0_65_40_12]|nr:MAG: IscS subfamily cysteine desulfurase [Cytophagales bacterium CG12_big_fil_rev_8_21_14_0_65_40_12]PIW05639.1 MAG: IscS subfamily cysteine desulfurase [Cytophagales bacterium CG17_big_fil_post_rev_8_21_14_2_50_40_13]
MAEYIYLDNNSTTPVDPRVIEAMIPFFSKHFANASSNHRFGQSIKKYVDESRLSVSSLINARPSEIVFTSGATEALNLALKGLVSVKSETSHIITSQSEHPAVLDTCRSLENQGVEVTYLRVNRQGLIDLKDIEQAIKSNTILVSIMLANNETGVIQPIEKIAEVCRKNDVLLLSDATQAIGKISVDVEELGVDLLAMSAHKFYGPKGIGALYIKKGIRLDEIIHGGGHENHLRSGTLNVPSIIGFGKACQIADSQFKEDSERISNLRDLLESELLQIEGSSLNGDKESRLPNTSNIFFPNVETDVLIPSLVKTIVSNGSACSSNVVEASHVLKSMGLSDAEAFSSIRISLGRFTSENDIHFAIQELRERITTPIFK